MNPYLKNNIIPEGYHFLALTEEVGLPDNITGQLWLKSKYARQGIQATFGKIDAGFKGRMTLSLFNSSNKQIEILMNKGIVQIVFERMSKPCIKTYEKRSGNYQNTKTIKV